MLDNLEKNACNVIQTLKFRIKTRDYTLTEDEYKIILIKDGDCLHYIPKEFRTYDICKLAVTHHAESLYYVPTELQTKELCQIAIKTNRLAFVHIHETFKTEEMFILALNQERKSVWDDFTDNALRHIPDYMRTKNICTLALKSSMENIKYVPHDLLREWLNIQ